MEDGDSWLVFGLTVLLVLLNSLLTVAEMAVRYSCARKAVPEIPGSLEEILPVIRTGRVLASLGLGWIGGTFAIRTIESWLRNFGLIDRVIPFLAFAIGFLGLVYLHSLFAGIIPKLIAFRKKEKIVRFLGCRLTGTARLFKPVIQKLQHPAFSWLWKLESDSCRPKKISSENEFHQSLYQIGTVDEKAYSLLDNIFMFIDRPVREVMVPRMDMVCFYEGQSFYEISETIRQYGHTRYPLCGKDKDEILGIIHIRDVLEKMQQGNKPEIKDLRRPVIFVPETMRLKEMLRHLQKERAGLAVVIDEFGGTSGLVTFEDLIAEILKEIPCPVYKQKRVACLYGKKAELDSSCLIEDVNQYFSCQIKDTHNDTIGGWVFSQLGRAPEIGDQVIFGQLIFTVKKIEQFRILRIEVSSLEPCQPCLVRPEEPVIQQSVHPEWEQALLHSK
ncbi:MAG: hemolysin family protein [Thermoactinomyces sp.]